MPASPRDRVLCVLVAALSLDTVVSMLLSLTGLLGRQATGSGTGARRWVGLVWFILLAAVLIRSLRSLRRLRRLLGTRDEQIAAVAATSHDWLWEADTGLVATSCSPAIGELLGCDPDQVIGRSFLDLLVSEDRPIAESILAAAVRERTGWQDVELRWVCTDGHPVTMLGSAVPVLNAAGRVIGFRGTRQLAPADTAARRRLAGISHRLDELLTSRTMAIAAQPIVDLANGGCTGVEALARFPDNRPPDVWFAEAHEAGRGVELELAAVHAALELLPHLPGTIQMSINASPALIVDPRLAETLTAPGIPLARLIVEITEHAAVSRYDDIHAALLPLRERGLALAIDDTGAGYASFTHVLHLRPDVIKLDRGLVTNIHDDPARRAFVTAIVLLALELGASVTAEGVETAPELAAVAMLGVDHAQGYFFARPTTDRARWQTWQTRTWPIGANPAIASPAVPSDGTSKRTALT